LKDRLCNSHPDVSQLPPAHMRYAVNGNPELDNFLTLGKRGLQDIEDALKSIGKNINQFENILDFGCGCGCMLLWFDKLSKASRLYGTDIRPDLIKWCHKNLKFASFSINKYLPPLIYHSEKFDFIYSISVFTHLDENYQFLWLDELKRIMQPKGILILTVHGEFCWKGFSQEIVSKIKKEGFLFISNSYWKFEFPQWYQNAEHTKEYISKRYVDYFDILGYIPQGMHNYQDLVILQKR
jgi:ubiquinone/menaquinone biosynthesis C-methylase UbiE